VKSQEPAPWLFSESLEARATQLDPENKGPIVVLRSRNVGLRKEAVAALAAAAQTEPGTQVPSAHLNLFPDTTLPLYVTRTQPTHDEKGTIVFGSVTPFGGGEVILTTHGTALSGMVRLESGESYEVFVSPDGTGEVVQVEFRGHEAEDDFVIPEEDENGIVRHSVASRLKPPASFQMPDDMARMASGDAVIDVLIAYTQRTREARGGTSGILSHLNTVIAQTNNTYANTQVPIQVRLVHAVEVQYDDSQSNMSYSTALSALRSSSDKVMDEVHNLRNQYGADVVSLFVSHPFVGGTVGMAYLMTSNPQNFSPWAFSVVHQNYAGGTSLTFSHEVGHNLGLHHDADNGGANGAFHAWSKGYQQKTLSPTFRTIMAYARNCSGCTSIPYFSNPRVSYSGIPAGVENEIDNARTMAYTAPFAEEWRAVASGPTCSYSLSTSSLSVPAESGTASVTVSTTSSCAWAAISNAHWITISGGASGTGNGTVTLSIAANTGHSSRSGTVTIAGQTVTVTQAPAPCEYTLSTSSISTGSAAGTASVSVTTHWQCNWTAVSNASWISVTAGASGAGNSTVL
jgi:peptidyl-Asp metalloendopeptidase